MRKIIDITAPLAEGLPTWPGDRSLQLEQSSSLAAGDRVNVSVLTCGVHTGTHVDAPVHFLRDGYGVDGIPLDRMMGPARVVEVTNAGEIDSVHLDRLEIPRGTKRLLVRTDNSVLRRLRNPVFDDQFVALTPDAARWLADFGVELIGVDYLSVQRFQDPEPTTHEVLLSAGIVILEGVDLGGVAVGEYELVCLPLRLVGCDGAPARAVLFRR